MSTLKDVLCALAIVIAYGIAGRMDYDDTVMLAEARHGIESPAERACAEGDIPGPEARAPGLEPARFEDCFPLDE
nr:hypothetical protein [uncultured Roseateles sp.]